MSGETIIITRPKSDEESLAGALQERGYRVIHEPLTEILLHHQQRHALHRALMGEPDAVIVTSRHGIHALALLSELRDASLLCVGDATAQAAYSLGFTRITAANGHVAAMIGMIAQSYDAGSRFLYASAEHVSTDIEAALREYHMRVDRLVLYEAAAATRFSDTLLEQLRRGQIDAATFFSQRSAQLFTTLLDNVRALRGATAMRAFCLSAAVARPLAENAWKGIHIAREATLASMVQEVDNIFLR